jgi:hypothetical protein
MSKNIDNVSSLHRLISRKEKNQILPEAIDNVRHTYKSIENKIDNLTELMKKKTQQPEWKTRHD